MKTTLSLSFVLTYNGATYIVSLQPVEDLSVYKGTPSFNIFFDSTSFGKLVLTRDGWKAPQFIPLNIVDDFIAVVKSYCDNSGLVHN